ncbi:NAD(P)H-binding protein [Streptomonospora sp. PA3]|uniref:NAD(P)-dependent oxidoreductase n=1 Tax=Streptomonospora sp. PA3 TaxID=2607326 RepID=UPI0012DFB56E|nr:NAD(P)H-binding protein [Streptomonospora sp. PA3]MUL40588.1 NAD(P)H-binding protein [Streptomonospora sp. PA3]
MNLTLMGATGGVGRAFARQACEAGHSVTALVRDPARLDYSHPRLSVTRADVADADALEGLVAGRDAVVSALGHRGKGPATVCRRSAAAAAEAMGRTGVRRLVVVSAAGLVTDEGDGPLTRLVVKPLLQRILRDHFADLAAMEETVRASGLDYTIVRPPRLVDRPRTGRYRTAVEISVRGGRNLSRADTADCMLACLEKGEPVRAAIHPAY